MGLPNGLIKLKFLTSLLLLTALAGCSNRPSDEGESTTSMESGYGYSSMSGGYKVALEDATVEDLVPHKVACPSQKKGKHQEQICIQICHVPPGNPENSHDKVLPLEAIKAHLGHGDYLGLCGASNNETSDGSGGTTDGSTTDGSSSGGSTGGSTTEDPATGGSTTEDPSTGGSTDDGSSSTNDGSSTDGSGEITEDGPTGDTISGGSDEQVPESGSSSGEDSSSGGSVSPAEPVVPNFCVPYYDIDQDCDGYNDSTGLPYL